MSVNNKNVIITGAAGGIGRAAALAFAKDGFGVLINYRTSEDAALALCREINEENGRAVCFRADVSARSEVDEMTDFARRELGRIGVLINNAGIAQQKMFCDITEQDFDRMMGVTVKGAFNCIQAALPDMVHEKSGKIINVSSMWGVCGASCEVHYSAAKSALIGLTKALARELGAVKHSGQLHSPRRYRHEDERLPRRRDARTSKRRISHGTLRHARRGGAHHAFPRGRRFGFHNRADDRHRRRFYLTHTLCSIFPFIFIVFV